MLLQFQHVLVRVRAADVVSVLGRRRHPGKLRLSVRRRGRRLEVRCLLLVLLLLLLLLQSGLCGCGLRRALHDLHGALEGVLAARTGDAVRPELVALVLEAAEGTLDGRRRRRRGRHDGGLIGYGSGGTVAVAACRCPPLTCGCSWSSQTCCWRSCLFIPRRPVGQTEEREGEREGGEGKERKSLSALSERASEATAAAGADEREQEHTMMYYFADIESFVANNLNLLQ